MHGAFTGPHGSHIGDPKRWPPWTLFLCKHVCCNNSARVLAREWTPITSYETGEADDGFGAVLLVFFSFLSLWDQFLAFFFLAVVTFANLHLYPPSIMNRRKMWFFGFIVDRNSIVMCERYTTTHYSFCVQVQVSGISRVSFPTLLY